MNGNCGKFTDQLGGYFYDSLIEAGRMEYLFKLKDVLIKVDQFGINSVQYEAPVGVFAFKRERREFTSPIKVLFDVNGQLINNFDLNAADKFEVTYNPASATYVVHYPNVDIETLVVPAKESALVIKTKIINKTDKALPIKMMPVMFPYLTSNSQAPWDSPEWYTRTISNDAHDHFRMTHLSPEAVKEDRRYLDVLFSERIENIELSLERLLSATKNLTVLPTRDFTNYQDVYGYEQSIAGINEFVLQNNEEHELTIFINVSKDEAFDEKEGLAFFNNNEIQKEIDRKLEAFNKIFSIRKIETPDSDFNSFVNAYIPLEISWVASLDRGWGTGMRGVRDAANDFMGYIPYDQKECRYVITNILSQQRSDGWYPRQASFDGSGKRDLRPFVDSACFFTELVYEYVSSTDDFSIFDEIWPYYDCELKEDGFTHLVKGIEYLMKPENLGEHGLVKLQGGDWLDCLNGVGRRGRAETVMVSCQLILSIEQLIKIAKRYRPEMDVSKYIEFASKMKESINNASYNKEGFYNAIFADNGVWYLSEKDEDGVRRVYAPTNTYCLLTGVAEGKEQSVIRNLETLKTEYGYKLFSEPFGATRLEMIGKMGSGDFPSYFAENGSVYNHGSQGFYLRALAKIKDYERFNEVLRFAMPVYREEMVTCSPKYALTNCYQLIPAFKARVMFTFLTGSIAMVERAIYNWMFGINFEPSDLVIEPCIPENYRDSSVYFGYKDKNITLKYNGFGVDIESASVNGKPVELVNNKVVINKNNINEDLVIEVTMKNK